MNQKTIVWVNVAFIILTGIASGSVTLAGVPEAAVTLAKAWAGNAVWIITSLNVVFPFLAAPQQTKLTVRKLFNRGA